MADTQPLVRQPKTWTGTLMVSISVAIIGSSLQFGFQTGNMANTQGAIKTTFNSTSTQMSFIVSGMAIGGLFGGLLAGYLADLLGRKRCMLLNNIPMIVGTVLMCTSGLFNPTYGFISFLLGRIIAGFACGVSTGVAPMYIAEISPVSVRGAVGVSHQFMITFGILLGFLISMDPVIHANPAKHGYNDKLWKIYFAFPIIPALYQILLLPFCPESPNWLYYNKEREDLAKNAITRLRNSADKAENEINNMIQERTAATDSVMVSYSQLFTNPTLRLSLLIGIGLQGAQQLSGVNAILNYAPDIFKQANFKNTDVGTVLTGAINVGMTFVSIPLMDKLGRRTLMLGGLFFMMVSYVGIAIAQTFTCTTSSCSRPWTGPVSLATVFTFMISFAIGPGSIPWLIVAELFTAEARGKASSLCVGANWLGNLLVVLTYDSLNKALKPYTFFLYMGVVVFFFLFTLIFVPETKQKTVDQITREIEEQATKFPPTVF